MRRRLQQVDKLTRDEYSYDGYMCTLSSAMSPNYTEYGWALTRAPNGLWEQVEAFLEGTRAFETAPLESRDIAIETLNETDLPIFVNLPDELKKTVLQELQPILEAWAGRSLVPKTAYGLRVYRNTSKMHMHLDQRRTHVISAIFHIGHDTQTPWPLVIEDFEGTTNAIELEAGDLLLYESSKCWHGRPRRMNGNYYTSLFLHYYPEQFAVDPDTFEYDLHMRVPPHWQEASKEGPDVDSFQMVETFCWEPDCPDEWCALKDSKVTRGPAPSYGKVLTANGKITSLNLSKDYQNDEL